MLRCSRRNDPVVARFEVENRKIEPLQLRGDVDPESLVDAGHESRQRHGENRLADVDSDVTVSVWTEECSKDQRSGDQVEGLRTEEKPQGASTRERPPGERSRENQCSQTGRSFGGQENRGRTREGLGEENERPVARKLSSNCRHNFRVRLRGAGVGNDEWLERRVEVSEQWPEEPTGAFETRKKNENHSAPSAPGGVTDNSRTSSSVNP